MTDLETIGIMADSHGNADMIAAALRLFQASRCGRIVHLGDICDSVAFEQTDACVELLRAHRVLAVKGNNDHALVRNGQARQSTAISAETIAYLEALPLQIELAAALFVHSRPFADTLGMAAMTGDIDQAEVSRFREQYPGKILFRGHGHTPRVFRLNGSPARVVSPDAGNRNRWQVDRRQGWIVTCGALFKGLCMTWSPASGSLISHRLSA